MKRKFIRAAALLTALSLAASLPALAVDDLLLTPAPEEAITENTDTENTPPTEVVLTQMGEYQEGRIVVTDGYRYGYADVDGNVVIPVQFHTASAFSRGMATVSIDEGKSGLLHHNGTFLIGPEYDTLTDLGSGIWLGQRDEVYDLLSINPFPAQGSMTQKLYSDLISATVSGGALSWVILQEKDGSITRMTTGSLPSLLQERRVPGWQFPLSSRTADFQDVSGEQWYDLWVDLAYSTGLMQGTGDGMFEPLRTLTVAEALHLAACMESRALQDDFHLQSTGGSLWYAPSVAYCEAVGLITTGQFSQADYSRSVTRAEMADIFSSTTPVRSISPCNDLERIKDCIPDVTEDDPAAAAIYGMYAKGILNGTDAAYSFSPDSGLTRAEAAAVVTRIARPEQRIILW